MCNLENEPSSQTGNTLQASGGRGASDLPATLRQQAEALKTQAASLRAVAEVMESERGPQSSASAGQKETDTDTSWRERLWTCPPETRLNLAEIAEALDCSERQVRRYIAGETDYPVLPAADGPLGKTVRAVTLRRWLHEAEEASRWLERS